MRRIYWLWMIPVLLVACWLGARSLNTRPIWDDERRSIFDAGGAGDGPLSPVGVWKRVTVENPWHAPGYFLALNAWGRVVGWQPMMLRALSLLAGLLAIALTYRFGSYWLSPRVGLYAAIILATSAFFAYFMVEMRIYAAVSLLSILTLWAYLRIVEGRRPAHWAWWIALFVGVVGTLYSHYLAAITLVGIGAHHLLIVVQNRRRLSTRTWWVVIGVMVVAGILFLPWLRVMLTGLGLAQEKETLHVRALSAPGAIGGFLWMFSNSFVVLMLVLAAVAVWASRGDSRTARHLRRLWLIAVVAIVALLAVNQVLMIMHAGRLRYFIPVWPLMALIIGAGMVRLRPWTLRVAVLLVWAGVGLYATFDGGLTSTLDGANITYPVQHIADTVRGHLQKGDMVVNYLPDALPDFEDNLANYYYSLLPVRPDYKVVNIGNTPAAKAFQRIEAMPDINQHPRVWIGYPRGDVGSLATFEAGFAPLYQRCGQLTQAVVSVDLYVLSGTSCPSDIGG